MKTVKIVVPVIFFLTLAVSLYAAGKEDNKPSVKLDRNGFGLSNAFSVDIALIETSDGLPSGAAHAFCLALTPEQIGFAIDTLEALAMDGMLTEGLVKKGNAVNRASRCDWLTVNPSRLLKKIHIPPACKQLFSTTC